MNIVLPTNWIETSENHFVNTESGFVIREIICHGEDNENNTFFQILDYEGFDVVGECFTIFQNPFEIADNSI